jgi:uncharacterized protein YbjT (DUF2867 family)
MKIFLTGATGFVGRHTIPLLTSAGHQLRCLVRSTSDTTSLKSVGATLIAGDISNKDALRQGMAGCDCMLHLAGAYSFWEPDRDVFRRVNAQGHAQRHGVRLRDEYCARRLSDLNTTEIGDQTPQQNDTTVVNISSGWH